MRVIINLATHPYEDAGRFWFRWGGALAALGVLTLTLVFMTVSGLENARRDRDLIRQREEQIAVRDQQRTAAQALMNLPQNSSTRDRSQFLNDLFQRKAFSWTKAFEDLEPLMPPRLHVVSVRPEMSSDGQLEIRLAVAGDSQERAIELVRKMEGSQHFQQTQIEQETFSTGQGGNGVEFNITALYVPETDSSVRDAAPKAGGGKRGGL